MTSLNKPDLLAAMSAHVRATGLAGASLRPLARAAGTSDRMLIYHFGSKERLIAELLDHITHDILSAMAAALPERPALPEPACLRAMAQLLRTPTFRPYLRVWLDILSAAGRGDPDHAVAAKRLLTGQRDWIIARLPPETKAPAARASEMLTLIHGVLVLEVAGLGTAADAAVARFYPAG